VRLPPWPHRIDVVARDRAGNETRTGLTVMGGVDLVRAPWELWLLVGAALLVVAWQATRRARRTGPEPATVTAPRPTAIEDLPLADPGIEPVRRPRTGFRQPPR
jgi:hypothetical protein